MRTLSDLAIDVLNTADADQKASLSRDYAEMWRSGDVLEVGTTAPPRRPARPDRPELRLPRDVPRRRLSADPKGRIALLHALAHIELNAIDLAWDIVARFTELDLPKAFYDDWVTVADEEGLHFQLLQKRLVSLGSAYGEKAAHDGLWQAAMETSHDLAARLAIVPLVLEARGLDVTPPTVNKLRTLGDDDSADILEQIYNDEIGHVAAGKRWFDHMAAQRDEEPVTLWRGLVKQYFKGQIKPPFNIPARDAANFPSAFYSGFSD